MGLGRWPDGASREDGSPSASYAPGAAGVITLLALQVVVGALRMRFPALSSNPGCCDLADWRGPLPDGVQLMAGNAYNEQQDPRQTALQRAFTDEPVEVVAAFYLDALPGSPYQIDESHSGVSEPSEIEAGATMQIWFTNDEGHRGRLLLIPGSALGQTEINIELYRAG